MDVIVPKKELKIMICFELHIFNVDDFKYLMKYMRYPRHYESYRMFIFNP